MLRDQRVVAAQVRDSAAEYDAAGVDNRNVVREIASGASRAIESPNRRMSPYGAFTPSRHSTSFAKIVAQQ
ncbi:MAG: hypothetical protein WAU52_04495 [Burkholderiales bacterium]